MADLGPDAMGQAPGEPAQAVFAVVVGVHDLFGDEVAEVGDGGLGQQVRGVPAVGRDVRGLPQSTLPWSGSSLLVWSAAWWRTRRACSTARKAWASMHTTMLWCQEVHVRTW